MLIWLINKFKRLLSKNIKENSSNHNVEKELSKELEHNLTHISATLGQSSDLAIRRFTLDLDQKREAGVVYIDGLADKTTINDHILRPLMIDTVKIKSNYKSVKVEKDLDWLEDSLITANDLSKNYTLGEAVDAILKGDTVLLVQGFTEALQINSKGWDKRAISEPQTELVLKGPRVGFIEDLRTNTALLRRKIGHPHLIFETLRIGRKTRTDINIAYISGIVQADTVEEVRQRLQRIDTDAILSANYNVEFIEDAPFSLFPTIAYTERPDVAAAKLLEGRVAIIMDGTPMVYTAPMLFIESFQSPDDYNIRPFYASLIRWIRLLSFILTILLPAMFVALTTFHQELIPTPLIITISAASDGTPFPAAIEVIVMGVIFEILREAGIRMPRPFGPAVSIVGGLVIGEAAVGAGLIGEPTVIVIALTAIASYVVQFQAEVSVFIRLSLVVLSGFLGLYGILLGIFLMTIHLASLRSFGVPYLSPFGPLMINDLKDTLIRVPHWAMIKRPDSLEPQDGVRQKSGLRPKPPRKNEG